MIKLMLRLFRVIQLVLATVISAGVSFAQELTSEDLPISPHQLPFLMPNPAVLSASPRKVFAHYITQFPRSFDNRPSLEDYYDSQYLKPEGENNKFKNQGGFIRQRPLPRAVIAESSDSRMDWRQQDLCWEVQTAARAGIDGFVLNLLETQGVHWERAKSLLAAAATVPGFRIVLMPDVTSAFKTPQEVIDAMVQLGASPAAYRLPDGRLVVAPYCAQIHPNEWWDEVDAGCKAQGLRVAFFPVLQSLEIHFGRFARNCFGISEWGMRTPEVVVHRPDFAGQSHRQKMLWMEPISPQDMRAKDLFLFEAGNTELFRSMWQRAIDKDADWVQLITWNDYSEATEIAPSTGTGWMYLDLTSWYAARFKTGAWPKVERDTVWLVHRTQESGLKPRKQPKPFFWRDSTPRDEVEAVVLLTSAADITLTSGKSVLTQRLQGGLSRLTVPLAVGRPSVEIKRQGRLVLGGESGWSVVKEADYQDLLYRATELSGPAK